MKDATTTQRKPTTRDMGTYMSYARYLISAAELVARLLVDGHGQDAAGGENDGRDEVRAEAHPTRDARRSASYACCFHMGS